MARRSGRSRQRDTFDIANPVAASHSYSPTIFRLLRPATLRTYEDRRTWSPDPVRPAASFSKPRHRLRLPYPSRRVKVPPFDPLHPFVRLSSAVSFVGPRRVLICVRRHVRKQVLHALGRTGRGGGGAPRHYNEYSSIHC